MPVPLSRRPRTEWLAAADNETRRTDLSAQDFIGQSGELQLSAIVTAPGGCTVPLRTKQGQPARGTITVAAEELQGANNEVKFALRGAGLAALDWFGREAATI